MLLNYEYQKKLRIGFIGAGEHAYCNILPCLQYAPVDLIALADPDKSRGLAVARQFGAKRFYPNYKALLKKEKDLEAIFIVVGPDKEGKPQYKEIAVAALEAGFHVWIDAPPCASGDEVSYFTNACLMSNKFLTTGFKKMFMPAYLKVAELIENADFEVSTFSYRYPLSLPPEEERKDPKAMAAFLQFVHPYSLLVRLFGECEGFTYMRSRITGGLVMNIRYRSGIVGTLHLTGGQSATSPLERLEVIGNGENIVVENGIRFIHYRAGGTRGKDREISYIGPEQHAPIFWEPEFSLGKLYNKQLFLQGYANCIRYFAESILAGEPPKHGNLVDMLHIMQIYDRLCQGQENEWITTY
ncbi:MAG: Gfo/Idh/MocA family oxidoreductase [Anaerolineae bacterium]|nr:Gfo/Idh/MocA family oxidoreductase [Anaerolineae bacterium]